MIATAICNSYKKELLDGIHRPTDTYMIALFTAAANLGRSTKVYTNENEVPEDLGYEQGGIALSGYSSGLAGDTAYIDWSPDPSWSLATITARGCMIYNASRGKKAVAVYDFGQDVVSVNGTFTVNLPAPGIAAVVRVS